LSREAPIPRYLHRDRDAIYGEVVRKRISAHGMKEVISAKQSPWQNPYAERVIGSIRRECTGASSTPAIVSFDRW